MTTRQAERVATDRQTRHVEGWESAGEVLARLSDMKEPAPVREPDRWDMMAIGFFVGVFLTTTLVLAITYFGR